MNARLSKYDQKRHGLVPIYAAAVDIPAGAMLRTGPTAETDLGAVILASGASDIPGVFGVLEETLDYSADGETLANGTNFVLKKVGLAFNHPIVEIEFSLATADTILATSSSGTTLTVASLEDNIDASFIYVTAGTGRGQLQFLTASAAGSATLKAAFGTSLDATSRVIKILRRYHGLVALTSDGTKLTTAAAAGAVNARILDIRMIRASEKDEQLDPEVHPGKSGLHNSPVRFVADVIWLTTAGHTID